MRYTFYRNIRTTQERRASQDGYARPKRNLKNLPSAWDDIPRHIDRCWKRHRKTQYKVIDPKPKKNSSKYAKSMSKRDRLHLEHRWCRNKYRRCNYCWRNHIWDERDKYLEKCYRKHQQEGG